MKNVHLIIVRHLESEKNIHNTFSSIADNESLTPKAINEGRELSRCIWEFAQDNSLVVNKVYTAPSERAIQTSKLIADSFGVSVKLITDLSSIKSVYPGLSEEEIEKKDPEFFVNFILYRNGLFNSYNLPLPPGGENVRDFEKRITTNLKKILREILSAQNNLGVIVGHRSSITAMLLHIAKKYYGYPKGFYGYIPLDVGNICHLFYDGNQWKILKVNISSKEILMG